MVLIFLNIFVVCVCITLLILGCILQLKITRNAFNSLLYVSDDANFPTNFVHVLLHVWTFRQLFISNYYDN